MVSGELHGPVAPGIAAAGAGPCRREESVDGLLSLVGVAQGQVEVPDGPDEQLSALFLVQVEAVPSGVEILHDLLGKIRVHHGVHVDEPLDLLPVPRLQSVQAFRQIFRDEPLLLQPDGLILRQIAVNLIVLAARGEHVPGGVGGQLHQIADVGFRLIPVAVDAHPGLGIPDFLRQQVHAPVFAVEIDLHGQGGGGEVDALQLPRQLQGHVVPLEGLVADVGQKDPDLVLAGAQIEEVHLFGELHLVGLLLVAPGVVAAAPDLHRLRHGPGVVRAADPEVRQDVLRLGLHVPAGHRVDGDDGHVQHVVVEVGRKDRVLLHVVGGVLPHGIGASVGPADEPVPEIRNGLRPGHPVRHVLHGGSRDLSGGPVVDGIRRPDLSVVGEGGRLAGLRSEDQLRSDRNRSVRVRLILRLLRAVRIGRGDILRRGRVGVLGFGRNGFGGQGRGDPAAGQNGGRGQQKSQQKGGLLPDRAEGTQRMAHNILFLFTYNRKPALFGRAGFPGAGMELNFLQYSSDSSYRASSTSSREKMVFGPGSRFTQRPSVKSGMATGADPVAMDSSERMPMAMRVAES